MANRDVRNVQRIFAGGASASAPPVAGEDVARINQTFSDYGGVGQYDTRGARLGVQSGPSINWGAIGGNILKSLSVPQAAAATGLYKLSRAGIPLPLIGPVGTAGLRKLFEGRGDISWKNALGDFYDPEGEEFERGTDNAFSKILGTKNKYALLGAQLVIDPLWAVGITTIPAKAKTAVTAAQALDGGTEAARAIKAALPGNWKQTMAKAFTKPRGYEPPPGTARLDMARALTKSVKTANRDEKVKLARALTSIPRITSKPVRVVRDQKDLARALASLGADTRALRVEKAGKLSGRTTKIQVGKKVVNARLIRGRYAVVLSKTADDAPYYAIYDLGPDFVKAQGVKSLGPSKALSVDESVDSLAKVRDVLQRHLTDAQQQAFGKAAKRRRGRPGKMTEKQRKAFVRVLSEVGKAADQAGVAAPQATGAPRPLREAMARAIGGARQSEWVPPAMRELPEDIYEVNKFGAPENLRAALGARREAATSQFGDRVQLALGLGGSVGVKIPLPIHLNTKGLSSLKAGVFGLKPLEKAAHAITRAGDETMTAADRAVMMAAEEFGMVEEINGVLRFKEQPAVLTGIVRSVRSAVGEEEAELVKNYLRERGLWDEQLDKVYGYMDDRYQVMRAQDFAGMDPAKKRAQLLKDVEAGKEDAENQLRDFIANMEGRYTPQARRMSQTHERRQEIINEFRSGQRARSGSKRFQEDAEKLRKERDYFRNPFTRISPEQFIDDMIATGLDRSDAQKLMSMIDQRMSAKTGERFAKEAQEELPEWNAMELLNLREKHHVMMQIEQQIDELIEVAVRDYGLSWDIAPRASQAAASGISKYNQEKMPDIVRALKYGVNQQHPGSIRVWGPADWVLGKGMPFFKQILTTINPAHFVSNAYGDFRNALINGNWRHFTKGAGASMPRSQFWNLGAAGFRHSEDKVMGEYLGTGVKLTERDRRALEATYDLGNGRTMTGLELDMMTRMVGLGRGFHTTDIGDMVGLFKAVDSGNTRSVMNWMARRNINRENAQRIATFVRHVQAGHDPIYAGALTVRVHFDYSELSQFEKLVLRNVLLFYTWLKKNAILQATGVATRPALYNSLNTFEGSREKYLNEPDYYKMQGAIGTPLGNLVMPGDPYLDVYKFEFGWDSFRKNVLGAVNPGLRVPTEIGLNRSAFTGGEVQKYEGEYKQSVIAGALAGLGIPMRETSARAGGPMAPGLPAKLQYALSQTLGPQVATAQNAYVPNEEGPGFADIISRITGIGRIQQNRPEEFARSKKYRDAKKKGDATRARNAQGG